MTQLRPMIFALMILPLLSWPMIASAQEIAVAEFPAAALVRGENVWLRLDPAIDTEVVTLLQRGDPITLTGESVFDGDEEFYPVDADNTGDSGWIDVLFIDPRSIAGTSTVVVPLDDVDVLADESETVDEAGNQRQQNREARRQERQADADSATEPELEAEAPADDRVARRAARQTEQDPVAAEEQPAADRAARRDERQAQQGADAGGANASSDSLTFSGEEPTVTPEFTAPADVLTVTASHEGDANFSVLAYTPDGYEELLFNEIGPYSGESSFEIPEGSAVILDIDANGPWEISIAPAF